MNGIGGRTIAEAQETMSYAEYVVWLKFRNKRGSLHLGMRIEESVARFMATWVNSKTKPDTPKFHKEDFAPHMDERVIPLDEIAAAFGDAK